MKEKEQLFGLMVLAEEQQKSAQAQLGKLGQQVGELQRVLMELPQMVEKTACDSLEMALNDQVRQTVQEACKGLVGASASLEKRLSELTRQVDHMERQLYESMGWVTWRWLTVFFVGTIACLCAFMILIKMYVG